MRSRHRNDVKHVDFLAYIENRGRGKKVTRISLTQIKVTTSKNDNQKRN